jgi:carbon storage regulator
MEDAAMLVLTRKLGEKIYIGPDIALTVVDVQGGRVRLGFEAPSDVRVLRAELCPFAEEDAERRERQAVF